MALITSSSLPSLAVERLQEDLRYGLTCIKDLWGYEVKDWVTGVHAADINLDGDIEVLAASRDGRVRSLTRDGRPRWEKIIGEKRWLTTIAAFPPFAELEGACVATSASDGKVYVLNPQGEEVLPPGSGNGGPGYWFDAEYNISQMWMDTTPYPSIVFAADNHCAYSFDIAHNQLRWKFSTPTDDPIRAIFTCDLNGDGLSETLIGSDNHYLYLLSNTGELLTTRKMEQAIYTLFAADIDKDGKIEILIGTRTKKLFILGPDLEEKWAYGLSSRPLTTTVADVNNDHQLEILVACDDKSLTILDNQGKLIWRQDMGKRFRSLNTFDLDRDGHIEVLAGTDDSQIYAFRVQLIKDLDKKIRRDYSALGKPDITTLLTLTREQLELLLNVLGETYGGIDQALNITATKALIEAGDFTNALLSLLKLDRQKFQVLWEKKKMGYLRALCLADLAGDKRREVVVSSRDGGLSIFNARGRLLWSEKSPDNSQIFDAQSGYLTAGNGEELAFATGKGVVVRLNSDKAHSSTVLNIPEPAACFYILAPNAQSYEMLVGTKSGKVYLYTNTFDAPTRVFDLPNTVQRVYASDPDEGGKYRNPELLISTSDNVLFAYTRGVNRLWTYATRSRILALCAKDLDGDGRLEVLIGTEDRNIYVLDDEGNLRWRYVLYHSVLALETADIDGDGSEEILAGCADGILYVFTSTGDLTWRYAARDPIQALRVADIDLDNNFEIVMVEENHLEVLQVVNRQELTKLITFCWEHLLTERDPLEALYALMKHSEPLLRAAGLAKLIELSPLPPGAFDLFNDATHDAFTDVRKILPATLMHAYPVDPTRAGLLLNNLFIEPTRDVRIEVVEHLELLANHDWTVVHSYLGRALDSDERNTRRAALRKISHLLKNFADEIKASQHTHGETLFKLLLVAAQDTESTWVREETGRVLADFLNLFETDFLVYLSRLFSNRLKREALDHTAYNLKSMNVRQVVVNLVAMKFDFEQVDVVATLTKITEALKTLSQLHNFAYSTDLWLIYRELLSLFKLNGMEELASYEFRVKPEQFQVAQASYPYALPFLHVGDQISSITSPLKPYSRRSDPNDRLILLLESISAFEVFQRLVDREYGVSPLPGAPQPYQAEYVILKGLIARWQELFNKQRNDLRGHPDLKCELQSRTVHLEETVGIWLQVSNKGRAPASKVKVTLLTDESFTNALSITSQLVDVIPANQDVGMEFLIKPIGDSVTLTFEVIYDDAEHEQRTLDYQERLDFIERPQEFIFIANPYSTGTPLHDGRMCYGREAPLAYLQDNLTRTSAQTVMVLYGQRRSGKTTLLNQLVKSNMFARHIAAMIDLQALSLDFTLNNFIFKITYTIYKAAAKHKLALPMPRGQDFVDVSPSTARFNFELFLDKVESILEDRLLILLLDEFEELEEQVKQGKLTPEIFKYLRSVIQERPYIQVLLSGTKQIEKLTRNYWSVFFNIAMHHRLSSRISIEGAIDLITKPVSGFLDYEPQVVNKIRQLTADQPYMIHLLCRSLVDHCNDMKKNYATINDVNMMSQAVLGTGTIHFDWLWKRFELTEQRLLQVIAEGSKNEGRPLDLDDIRAIYKKFHYAYEPLEVINSLKTLWAEDVISTIEGEQQENVSENAHYTLANGLFRLWLRQNRPLLETRHITEAAAANQDLSVSLQSEQSNGAYNIP
ncbi:MAG TPA: AAA family ATPase [Ktedonobacteraceae bacterium]